MTHSLVHWCSRFLAFSALFTATAADWPAWRGPAMTGVSSEKNLPLKWSDKENVRWRVALPGPGNSSPIVWGSRVFLSQAVQNENRRTLMCFDRAHGKLLWQSGVIYAEPEPTSENNPYCAGSPATDGERVYVCFGSAGVYAYDYDGREVWHRDLGKLNHMFGNAVSPVLAGDLCVLHYGPDAKARLVALKKQNGEIAWDVEPPKPEESELQMAGPGGPGGTGGPGGRPGGPGGPGGFGPGMMLAQQMLSQGDKNADGALTKEELSALADAWFDKLDPDKTGKLSQEQFSERLNDVLGPPPGPGGPGERPGGGGQRPGGGRGFGPGRFLGPGLFALADTDKDGTLTRSEFRGTFEKWASEWDTNKRGSLNAEQLRAGLDAALPRPNFGGPGGRGAGGPGGRGPGGPGGPGGGDPARGSSWSTPIVVNAAGREEVILSTAGRLAAYDPASGKQLWMSKGLGASIYTSPVWGDGVVFAATSGPGGGPAIAVKAGGSGDVTASHRVWRLARAKSEIGSGVIYEGHLYTITQEGIAQCLDLNTGGTVWEERLRGPGPRGGSWSSMLLADGRIYVPNQSGDVFVLRAAPTFELVATNSVDEPTNASLAASNGELFMRTDQGLWCFTKPIEESAGAGASPH